MTDNRGNKAVENERMEARNEKQVATFCDDQLITLKPESARLNHVRMKG